MTDTKTVSLDELRSLKAAGKISAPAERIPSQDLPDEFWNDAEVVLPKVKQAISLRVDPDVLDFFKEQGSGHLTRMHAVLKAYVRVHKKRTE